MILFDKITIKISQIVTLFPHYGKLSDFPLDDHIIYFHMYFQYLSSSKNTRTMYQKRVTFYNFWNISSYTFIVTPQYTGDSAS